MIRWATAEQQPTAMRASRTMPSTTSSAAATMTIEITRYRRAPSLRNAERMVSAGAGITIAVTISSSASKVRRGPTMN
jgi:hypothetical protein